MPGSDGTMPKGGLAEQACGLGIGVATGSSVPRGLPRTRSIHGRSGSGSYCSYGRPPRQELASGLRLARVETEVAVPTGRASETGGSPGSARSELWEQLAPLWSSESQCGQWGMVLALPVNASL